MVILKLGMVLAKTFLLQIEVKIILPYLGFVYLPLHHIFKRVVNKK